MASVAAASRKAATAPSLVVAASVGAVEALKDQAGLCRWGYALRSLYRRAATAPRIRVLLSETSAGDIVARPAAAAAAAEKEAVRLRKAHHLVCWGPN